MHVHMRGSGGPAGVPVRGAAMGHHGGGGVGPLARSKRNEKVILYSLMLGDDTNMTLCQLCKSMYPFQPEHSDASIIAVKLPFVH